MLAGTTYEEKIWNYLIAHEFTPAGAAGMMGNMYAESGLIPNNLQNTGNTKLNMTDAEYTSAVDSGKYTNFVNDNQGYGLCQWTWYTRKQELLDFAKKSKKSIGDLEMQLDFLMKELSKSFSSVLTSLKKVTDVKTASDKVLLDFEKPADTSSSMKNKRYGYAEAYYNKYAKTATQKGGSVMDLKSKITTAAQLAERAEYVAKNFKTLYVMGCFGAPLNAANKTRYCSNHTYNMAADRQAMIKAASADTFGFDCVNLIKGLLWGWYGDTSKTYGGATYNINGVPDTNANGMINLCKNVTTDFSKIEVGEALWCEGHIGVYIGNGLGVECTPSWQNKVQITAVGNIGTKSGYNTRKWVKHGKLPFVTYTGKDEGGTSASSSTTQSTTKPATSTSTSTATKEKKATGVAKSFDKSIAGTYIVTAPGALNVRNDAGTGAASMVVLPAQTKVQNYGYYTSVSGTKWLYIQVTYNGVTYTGFASSKYLKKQ